MDNSPPSYQHDIPDRSSINIGKLGSGGDLTSYTCNGESTTRHLIFEKVHETVETFRQDESDDIRVLEVDCWNHLRNVWIGGMKKALSNLIGNTMR